MLNPRALKSRFPIFSRKIKGKSIVYLDNASSTQKPKVVIDALKNFYENHYANIHRGLYTLSEEATEAYENARKTTAKFIHAKSEHEIVFTRNCTESINLVAYTWGESEIRKGDEIIASALEHHSNLVPWQELARKKSAKLKIIPLKNNLTLDLQAFKKLLNKKTRLVALTAMSNVTGTVPPVKEMIRLAHKFGARVLIDGAQSVAHSTTDVQKLDCDFLAFSSHKMLGPTGVGVLYAKQRILESIPPFMFGGDMVRYVTQTKASFEEVPWKFEAGTPNIADVVAFEAALKFLQKVGLKNIEAHEKKLLTQTKKLFSKYKSVQIYSAKNSTGILSFTIKGVHPHDISAVFNEENVCVRAGHHCAHPLMDRLRVPATARISFYLYNDSSDIARLEKALLKVFKIFGIKN